MAILAEGRLLSPSGMWQLNAWLLLRDGCGSMSAAAF